LQQTGEGAVLNVANKITKGLKYKIRRSQISLFNLMAYLITSLALLSAITKHGSLRNITALQ